MLQLLGLRHFFDAIREHFDAKTELIYEIRGSIYAKTEGIDAENRETLQENRAAGKNKVTRKPSKYATKPS